MSALSQWSAGPARSLLGAVLAGGQSVRFGRPKWGEPLGGRALALRAADALAPHAAEVVLVAPGPLPGAPLPVLADAPGGRGPLAGIVAALEHARARGQAGALVLACDLPLVDAGLIGLLVEEWGGEEVVAPERAGRLQPLCALWSLAALAEARAALAGEDRSVLGVAARLELRVLPEARWRERAATADPLLNVNTPAELARAAALLGGRSVPGEAG